MKCLTLYGVLVLACVVAIGCGKTAPAPVTATAETSEKQSAEPSHDGWWCQEHGVPEEQCAQCNKKIAADLKAKGDWCDKHGRPESQCFICHPELEAKFAALYEAKMGEKPPKRAAEETPKS